MTSFQDDEQLRLFFAVPLADHLLQAATAVQQQIADPGDDLKCVARENMHVTLKFVGDAPGRIVQPLTQVATRVARQHSPFDLTIAGAGAFPRPDSPRVIWLGATAGNDALAAIARDLDAMLAQRELVEPEQRPFHAHITIARNKGPRRQPQVTERITAAQDTHIGQMRVDHFVLMRSQLAASGPTYTVLERFPFGNDPAEDRN